MPGAFGTADASTLLAAAQADGGTDGCDLASEVTHRRVVHRRARPTRRSTWSRTTSGSRRRSSTSSSRRDATSRSCPRRPPRPTVLAREPDGVFLSNGPGDPAAVDGAATASAALLGEMPVFGICLGHQIMCARARRVARSSCRSATTAATTRCADLATGRVEITSQNHNYAVDGDSLPDGSVVTHLNLNDGDIEGVRTPDRRCFSRAVPPRSRARSARRALPVRRVPRPHAGEAERCPAATTSRRSSSSGAGRS